MSLPTEPIWIDDNEQLAELCQRWSQQAAIAVDTEFMRSQTFYPHAGLIQVGDGRGCYLIDPLAIDDFAPFKQLMLNPEVTKVLHSCSEDLELFRHFLGVIPTPLFDTQVAAAFVGHGFSIGYGGLIKAVLAVELSKGETRSDWMQRPLSQSQLHYAALDVAYLLVAYGKLLQALKQLDRLSWVLSDCADIVERASQEVSFDQYYLRVKSAWKLNPQELAVLQGLSVWRETVARQLDIPRNRLLKEAALWEIARSKPQRQAQLQGIEGLPARTVRESGERILALVTEALQADSSRYPSRLPKPLSPEQGDKLKALKTLVRSRAETLAMPAELLVNKKEYEAIIRSGMTAGDYQLPERLRGWRLAVVGEALLAAAQAF